MSHKIDKLWQFLRTTLEIYDVTRIVDARLAVVGRIAVGDSIRIEQVHPDVQYDLLIVDRKGFHKYLNKIPSINVSSIAFLSEKDGADEQGDADVLKFFYDIGATSDLSFDISSFGTDYQWLFVFRVDKKEGSEKMRDKSERPDDSLVVASKSQLPESGHVAEGVFDSIRSINFDALYDFEKPIVRDICRHINSYLKDSLMWYWKLGSYVDKLRRAAEKAGHDFRDRMAVLAGMLGNNTIRTLYKAKQVYDRWEEKEFKQLIAYNDKEGAKGSLSFRHMLALSRLDNDEEVVEYAEEVVNKGIPARDLEILLKGKGKPRGRGPETVLPSSMEHRLAKLYRQLVPLERTVKALCDDKEFVSDLADIELDDQIYKLLENLAKSIGGVLDDLQILMDAISKALSKS